MDKKTIVLWMSGPGATGKTTLCNTATDMGKKPSEAAPPLFKKAIYPGIECRRKYGADFISKQHDPMTPAITEGFVRQIIEEELENNKQETLIIMIDGCPRSTSQVDWLLGIERNESQYGVTEHYIINVICDEHRRQERLNKRETASGEAALNWARANQNEEARSVEVIEYAKRMGIRVIPLRTDGHTEGALEVMWKKLELRTSVTLASERESWDEAYVPYTGEDDSGVPRRAAPKVYLSGPVVNVFDNEDGQDWKKEFIVAYTIDGPDGKVEFLDPCRHGFDPRDDSMVSIIVERDLSDIRSANLVLLNYCQESVGAAMEAYHAHLTGRPVLAFTDKPRDEWSAWMKRYARIVAKDEVRREFDIWLERYYAGGPTGW